MTYKCPNFEDCPIYNGILKGKELTTKAYIKFYCDSEKYAKCKRYKVKEAVGVCPPEILPNSLSSVEEIVRQFQIV